MAVLERRGSTFGDLSITQFDDPLLTEHAMFLAVVDIPRHVSVSGSLFPSLLSPLPALFAFVSQDCPIFPLKHFLSFFVLSLCCFSHLIYMPPLILHTPLSSPHEMVEFSTAKLMIHVFQLHEDGPAAEELDSTCDTSAASHWMLPNCGLIIIQS